MSDAKDSTNKIQRLEFLENLYSKYIGLTVSILPKEEMLDVSDLGPNFNDMVILFQTVFKFKVRWRLSVSDQHDIFLFVVSLSTFFENFSSVIASNQ